MPEPYYFTRPGRSLASIAAVVVTWGVVLLAWVAFDAAAWLLVGVLIFTLPALWDIWSHSEAGLALRDGALSWYSGRHKVAVPFGEIDHVRLDTRLDFSVRATAVLTDGRRLRLPYEATPPHQQFESELNARNLRTQRHHFSLL